MQHFDQELVATEFIPKLDSIPPTTRSLCGIIMRDEKNMAAQGRRQVFCCAARFVGRSLRSRTQITHKHTAANSVFDHDDDDERTNLDSTHTRTTTTAMIVWLFNQVLLPAVGFVGKAQHHQHETPRNNDPFE